MPAEALFELGHGFPRPLLQFFALLFEFENFILAPYVSARIQTFFVPSHGSCYASMCSGAPPRLCEIIFDSSVVAF
jgi:hypothetical protein